MKEWFVYINTERESERERVYVWNYVTLMAMKEQSVHTHTHTHTHTYVIHDAYFGANDHYHFRRSVMCKLCEPSFSCSHERRSFYKRTCIYTYKNIHIFISNRSIPVERSMLFLDMLSVMCVNYATLVGKKEIHKQTRKYRHMLSVIHMHMFFMFFSITSLQVMARIASGYHADKTYIFFLRMLSFRCIPCMRESFVWHHARFWCN
jgi:hypothetical protein